MQGLKTTIMDTYLYAMLVIFILQHGFSINSTTVDYNTHMGVYRSTQHTTHARAHNTTHTKATGDGGIWLYVVVLV